MFIIGINKNESESCITNKLIPSTQSPDLLQEHEFDSTNDCIINKVPDINVDELIESSSVDSYSSEEYYTPLKETVYSDLEISDFDYQPTIQTSSCSTKKTNSSKNIVKNDSPQVLELGVQRVQKLFYKSSKIVKDKRVYCIFCESLVTNFPRHIERKHPLEPQVRSIIMMEKKSKERVKELELLKNKGNLQHNQNVLENKKGNLIVGRRPTLEDKVEVNDFLPCKYCFKFCKKKKIIQTYKNMQI